MVERFALSNHVKWSLSAVLFSCAQPTYAQVIETKKTWEETLQSILSEEHWGIESVYSDKQGDAVIVLRKRSCKPGRVGFCETGAKSFIDTPAARRTIQCFIPLQFDWCGIGMPTKF